MDEKSSSKIEEVKEKISNWIWMNIGWRFRYIYRKIRNLIRWTPIIWKDQDWDHTFIFEILKFKLKNQAKYIGGQDRHTTAKRDAELMMTCVRLIDRIQDGFYDGEYADYHEADFRFEDCEDKPGYSQLHIDEISNRFLEYFAKYPIQYKRAIDPNTHWYYTEKTDKTIAMWIGNENQKRAQTLLFKIMNEKIQGWWD
jgi:hypothetical protein